MDLNNKHSHSSSVYVHNNDGTMLSYRTELNGMLDVCYKHNVHKAYYKEQHKVMNVHIQYLAISLYLKGELTPENVQELGLGYGESKEWLLLSIARYEKHRGYTYDTPYIVEYFNSNLDVIDLDSLPISMKNLDQVEEYFRKAAVTVTSSTQQ